MRLRQIKSYLWQVIIAGFLCYMLIYLFEGGEEEAGFSIGERYHEYQTMRKAKSANGNIEESRIDKLALSMVEKMRESESLRKKTQSKEKPALPYINIPKEVLDVILDIVPGGRDAIARKDQVALDRMQELVLKYRKNYSDTNLSPSEIAKQFNSHMFDGQKMLGPMPDIRHEPQFFDLRRLMDSKEMKLKYNPEGFLQGGGSIGDIRKDQAINFLESIRKNKKVDQMVEDLRKSKPEIFEKVEGILKGNPTLAKLDANSLLQKLSETNGGVDGFQPTLAPQPGLDSRFQSLQGYMQQQQQQTNGQFYGNNHMGQAQIVPGQWPQGGGGNPAGAQGANPLMGLLNKLQTQNGPAGGANSLLGLLGNRQPPQNGAEQPNLGVGAPLSGLLENQQAPQNGGAPLFSPGAGDINMHELIKVKNLIENGGGLDDVRKMLKIGSPQAISNDPRANNMGQNPPPGFNMAPQNVPQSNLAALMQNMGGGNALAQLLQNPQAGNVAQPQKMAQLQNFPGQNSMQPQGNPYVQMQNMAGVNPIPPQGNPVQNQNAENPMQQRDALMAQFQVMQNQGNPMQNAMQQQEDLKARMQSLLGENAIQSQSGPVQNLMQQQGLDIDLGHLQGLLGRNSMQVPVQNPNIGNPIPPKGDTMAHLKGLLGDMEPQENPLGVQPQAQMQLQNGGDNIQPLPNAAQNMGVPPAPNYMPQVGQGQNSQQRPFGGQSSPRNTGVQMAGNQPVPKFVSPRKRPDGSQNDQSYPPEDQQQQQQGNVQVKYSPDIIQQQQLDFLHNQHPPQPDIHPTIKPEAKIRLLDTENPNIGQDDPNSIEQPEQALSPQETNIPPELPDSNNQPVQANFKSPREFIMPEEVANVEVEQGDYNEPQGKNFPNELPDLPDNQPLQADQKTNIPAKVAKVKLQPGGYNRPQEANLPNDLPESKDQPVQAVFNSPQQTKNMMEIPNSNLQPAHIQQDDFKVHDGVHPTVLSQDYNIQVDERNTKEQPLENTNGNEANPHGEEDRKRMDKEEVLEKQNQKNGRKPSDSNQENVKSSNSSKKKNDGNKEEIFMSAQEFEMLAEKQNGGTTKLPDFDFARVRIVVVDPSKGHDGKPSNVTKVLTINDYKRIWKPQEYIRKYANPVKKSAIQPTLIPYGAHLARPNPKSLIKDLTMSVDTEEIEAILLAEKKRRIVLGDDDIIGIPEVKAEIAKNPTTVPNIIHYIWFSCHKYRVHHFISMKSALEIQRPSIILLHTNCTPSGAYWDEFVKEAGTTLKIVQRTPPNSIWGKQIYKVEHQSDVARLEILLEVGGIYMDDDMVILKSLDTLRNNTIVLGEENYDALANSILLSNRKAWFLKRWYQEYRSFNGSKWSHSSCFVPWSLWVLFPNTVYVVKEKLLRPNWEEIKYIYHELWDWSHNYAVHLYSRFMKALDGTPERPLRELAILNTTYGEISRFILWGNKKPRDITDWL